MDTKEKLEKKLDITKKKILGTLLALQENDTKKARKNMAQELNLGMDTIDKLVHEMKTYKKDKKDYKMVSYFSKITSSGVNLNVAELEDKAKVSKENLYNSINMAKYESFVSETASECISKEVLGFLKTSNVDDKIYQKAMQKYVSGLKINLMNAEDTFEFLYENGYNPENSKSTIDKVFKIYSESKSKDLLIKQKDEKIAELEQQLLEKDDIIFGKCNMINDLNTRIKELKSKDSLSDKERKELAKLEKLEEIDPEKMRAENKKARDAYEAKLAKAYYTSPKFLKDTAVAAGSRGAEMGMRLYKRAAGAVRPAR